MTVVFFGLRNSLTAISTCCVESLNILERLMSSFVGLSNHCVCMFVQTIIDMDRSSVVMGQRHCSALAVCVRGHAISVF